MPDEYDLEDASLQEKINAYLEEPIGIEYVEFTNTIDKEDRKFALIYIPPSSKLMTAKEDVKYKVGDKEKIAVLAAIKNSSSAIAGKILLSRPTIAPTKAFTIMRKTNCGKFSFNPSFG